MGWLDKRQMFPLSIAVMIILLVILGGNVLVHLSGETQAQANMHFWYMERSAGFSSYELLAISVILGASSSAAVWDRLRLRRVTVLLHQFAGILIFPFLALHLVGIYEDSSVPFTLRQIFVPGTAAYRNVATAFGIIALYALVLIVLSGILRGRKNGIKVWRTLHYLTYPTFIATTIHGFFEGTDSSQLWAYILYVLPMMVFVYFTISRLAGGRVKASG